ncbi:MAG: 1-deoxy-D-xylulose-5-phosphate reductoisomerase [Pirellulales bacterium]|nr:1-deoxy-D-xylulose-5-phosphate reductoisomerase [Pirellulales bacterium]
MTNRPKKVALLGSTGSIGRSTLEVIGRSDGRLSAVALSAHSNTELLFQQAARFRPRWIVVTDPAAAESQDWTGLPAETKLLVGPEAIGQIAADDEVETVVSAIVGSAGLLGTWAAIAAGKRVALANKESLVVGGALITRLAREHHAEIIPVDSEHSAVFQAFQAGQRDEVRRVILTASGGPFRTHTAEQLADVTVREALDHPTWQMGPKITVDSATLMNKALEIVEARWLFDLKPDQIAVTIHPQSVVHSIVEYKDGSMIAQLGSPDMKLPIQYALDWPERHEGVATRLDWSQALRLDFEPPDLERFPALELGLEVARRGGTAGAVLSGANEAAVAAFLNHELSFTKIVPAVRAALENHDFDPQPSLARVLELDRWARQEVIRWIGA